MATVIRPAGTWPDPTLMGQVLPYPKNNRLGMGFENKTRSGSEFLQYSPRTRTQTRLVYYKSKITKKKKKKTYIYIFINFNKNLTLNLSFSLNSLSTHSRLSAQPPPSLTLMQSHPHPQPLSLSSLHHHHRSYPHSFPRFTASTQPPHSLQVSPSDHLVKRLTRKFQFYSFIFSNKVQIFIIFQLFLYVGISFFDFLYLSILLLVLKKKKMFAQIQAA